MKMYTIRNRPVRLYSGILQLSDEQAASRRQSLDPVKGKTGWYRVTHEVCFKAGEIIGMADPVPKALSGQFQVAAAEKVKD